MITFRISGDTFEIKDELKTILPINKNFKGQWHFVYGPKFWELEIQNAFDSKTLKKNIDKFCKIYKTNYILYLI